MRPFVFVRLKKITKEREKIMNYSSHSVINRRVGIRPNIGTITLVGATLFMGLIAGCGDEQSGAITTQWNEDSSNEEALVAESVGFYSVQASGGVAFLAPNSVTLKCGKSKYQRTPSKVKRTATGRTQKAAKQACKAKLDGVAQFNTRCDSCDCTRPDTCYPDSTAVNVTYPGGCKEKSVTLWGVEFKWWECSCSSHRFRYSCSECQEPIASADAVAVFE